MTEKNLAMTPEQMRELLSQERQTRIWEFTDALQQLLKKHNCRLEAEVLIRNNGAVLPAIKVYANEDQQ